MKKIIKTEEAVLLGLGVASLAKDRMADFLKILGKKSQKALPDQKKLKKQLLARGKKEYQSLARAYEHSLAKTLKALNLPSRKEFEALKRQVKGKK